MSRELPRLRSAARETPPSQRTLPPPPPHPSPPQHEATLDKRVSSVERKVARVDRRVSHSRLVELVDERIDNRVDDRILALMHDEHRRRQSEMLDMSVMVAQVCFVFLALYKALSGVWGGGWW